MATPSRLLFLNLPVADLPASKAFFAELGFAFDPKMTDDSAACMIVSEQAWVMLLTRERFADFTTKPTVDAGATTQAIVCVSAADRDAVDTFAETALAAGASAAKEPMDYGFMYGRSFHDLDGHHWEVMWMSPEAIQQGPSDMAEQPAA